jgi:phenylacetate-CoA ligase
MIAKMMCKLRSIAFWCLDSLQGGVVKKAYQELKTLDAVDSQSAKLAKHQQTALLELLQHAITTTKFYGNIQGNSLSAFPVVDKNIIREQQDDFISRKYKKAGLHIMATSGSTGTPFICFQNSEKKKLVNAEVIYYSEKAGYLVGKNVIWLRAVTKGNYKSKLYQWIHNETLLDICNLDDSRIDKLLGEIDKVSRAGSMIKVYASTLEALRDYFRRKKVSAVGKGMISGIVSGADMLFDDNRAAISQAFNCRCFSRYSNQENGIIGQDDTENNVFILNEANYIVEIFQMDADEPAPEGEVGRIVITDLYNLAMPLIRYDTGDVGAIAYVKRNGVNKKAITNFDGRRLDIVYDCYGNRLSPHTISSNFWSFPEIKQFQFIQESNTHYTLKINVEGVFVRQNEMKALLQKLLGDKAVINIETVEEIPVLASGKRKYIVNHGYEPQSKLRGIIPSAYETVSQ